LSSRMEDVLHKANNKPGASKETQKAYENFGLQMQAVDNRGKKKQKEVPPGERKDVSFTGGVLDKTKEEKKQDEEKKLQNDSKEVEDIAKKLANEEDHGKDLDKFGGTDQEKSENNARKVQIQATLEQKMAGNGDAIVGSLTTKQAGLQEKKIKLEGEIKRSEDDPRLKDFTKKSQGELKEVDTELTIVNTAVEKGATANQNVKVSQEKAKADAESKALKETAEKEVVELAKRAETEAIKERKERFAKYGIDLDQTSGE
ncbi:MAG: hypothetical protein AAB664_02490, partial [Patescibacteria group bacterium]